MARAKDRFFIEHARISRDATSQTLLPVVAAERRKRQVFMIGDESFSHTLKETLCSRTRLITNGYIYQLLQVSTLLFLFNHLNGYSSSDSDLKEYQQKLYKNACCMS